MGGPLFWATMFTLVAIWAALLGLPAFRRPPPGFEDQLCPSCSTLNKYNAAECEKCKAPLNPRKQED